MPEWLVRIFESDKFWAAVIGGGAAWGVAKITTRSKIDEVQAAGLVRAEIEESLQKERLDADRRMEALKHELQRERITHEIKFKGVYDQVAENIANLFKLAGNVYGAGRQYFASFTLADTPKIILERMGTYDREFRDIQLFIYGNRVFLPRSIHLALESFLNALREVDYPKSPPCPGEVNNDEYLAFWKGQREKFDRVVTTKYEEFCATIQSYIGLNDDLKK